MARPEFDLERFVVAQESDYTRALAELTRGKKEGHWMWYIFPQIAGLGRSSTARHYAIASADEARAYMVHPVLGKRLRDCCRALLGLRGNSADRVLGTVDALKLRSCTTLFLAVSQEPMLQEVLDKFYRGDPDLLTLSLLEKRPDGASPI